MHTQDLIEMLAADVQQGTKRSVTWKLLAIALVGLSSSILLQFFSAGLRADAPIAWPAIIVKLIVCIILGLIWAGYLRSLSSPGRNSWGHFVFAFVAIGSVVFLGLLSSFNFSGLTGCLMQVWLLSIPAFIGLVWLLRSAAPVRSVSTGFAIGILAGIIGTFGYAFGCMTDQPFEVAFRYGGSILTLGALGAMLGPFMLKW